MNGRARISWGLRVFGIIATMISLGACCANYEAGAEAARAKRFAQSVSRSKHCLMKDVQVVVVFANGTTWPDPVKVKKDVQIVVWVGENAALNVSFPNSPHPFPEPVMCRTTEGGRFCVALLPPKDYNAGGNNTYPYSVGFATTAASDPNLEVVP